ncbi:uncharacterized protein [Macrobrachium rosenbergii]|uniref:uncharacterized protein n=1 Tax=Macrobrachium rosenbergii TaxID=79674 RepID=UPI0034D79317
MMDSAHASPVALAILVLIFYIQDLSSALQITKIQVPSHVATGESGSLECDFTDDGDTIYALKWYLGLDEFYRWTPAENPQGKTFPVLGNPIAVDLKSSRKGKVRFHHVTLEASGVYRCEVSAEAPSFHTESAVATMTVVDLPDGKPQIRGVRPSYQLRDEVVLNCSSSLSQPAAKLKFYINDEQADPLWIHHYNAIEDSFTGLETSVLGLRFPLWPRLLRQGMVSVKCTAEILNLYWDSSEAFILVDIPFHASIMEGRASGAAGNKTALMAQAMISTAALIFLCLLL